MQQFLSRGQLLGVGCLLPLCRSWCLNPRLSGVTGSTSTADPSHQPSLLLLEEISFHSTATTNCQARLGEEFPILKVRVTNPS